MTFAVGAIEAGAGFTIEGLGRLVRRHRADDSITRALARLIRTDRPASFRIFQTVAAATEWPTPISSP
jgi:hypothetical protein